MFRQRTTCDSRQCEDPRHNDNKARGKGGKRAVGVIETRYDSYAVCASCLDSITQHDMGMAHKELR